MISYLLVALGGALGSVLRFGLAGVFGRPVFPWGILAVNVTGSFLIGFLASLTGPDGRWVASTETRQFLMVGICGGYTTFSSFSLNTLDLARDGDWLRAGANIIASVACCLVAVWLGHLLANVLNQPR